MSASTTRGFARASCLAWRRSASSSSKSPPHKSSKPPITPPSRVPRPYNPATRKSTPQTTINSSSPSSSNPPPDDTLQTLWHRSWLPLSGAALLAGFLGFYIIGTVAASLKQCSCRPPREHESPTGRPPALTGDNAEQFDKELDLPEWWTGITKLRKRLAHHAKGDVLELAIGTGRNLEHYNWEGLGKPDPTTTHKMSNDNNTKHTRCGITSFTGLDISVDMLDVARKRLAKTVPPLKDSEPVVKKSTMADHTGGQLSFLNNRLRLIHSDAHRALPPLAATADAPAEGKKKKYDTIIQTFGLCSVSDPVAVLCNLASAIAPGTGRIVLLEHGKGWYGLVNGLLDKNAARHFDKYGCWWNRDIEALVDEAVQRTPGLEIVKLDRPNLLQMGTLVWVELRVKGSGGA
ncbi:hypothetical protein C2857_006245 [Epichloe festucae Fl1]|uniref:Ubiquinone/menaquinone biosynthesis-related protein n=1 Tax=Epichloe festucae (strain Fl1) TaxID=877507 RepID=A0A7S9KLH6_EPIFF|nr:hypothetical protein C2857_006245 [Epichloe festucae Fl1]